MNKKTKNNLIFGSALVLLLIMLFVFMPTLVPQSIVSVSNISVLDKGEFVQANIVVNNAFESVYFIPKSYMSTTLPDGSVFEARKDVELSFKPEPITCDITLKPVSRSIAGLYDYTYYVASNTTYFKNVPFSYVIERSGELVKEGVIDTADADSISFTTSDLGEINITKLGSLSSGYVCPSADSFAVIDTSNGLRVVSKSELEYRLLNLELTKVGACFDNPLTAISCIGDLLAISGVPAPSGYRVNTTTPYCPPNTSCLPLNGVYEDTLNTNKINYYLPPGSAYQSIVVNMNKQFVDGIVFSAPATDIEIVDVWLDISSLDFGQKTNLFVKIKNIGDTGDTVRVTPTTNPLNVSISPITYPLEINSGETKTAVFEVIASNNVTASESICATASTSGQFGGGVSKVSCVDIFVKQGSSVPLVTCGNGTCDVLQGENYVNCPSDCEKPVVPEDLDRLECFSRPKDWWVLGWNYTPPQAFGLIPSRCEPTYNYGLVVLGAGGIILLIIIIIGINLVLPKKRSRR